MLSIKDFTEKYPELFKSSWGLECGDGWIPIIEKALTNIELLNDNDNQSILSKLHVIQLKEKFGTMRFYYRIDSNNAEQNEKVSKIVNNLEIESETTCEGCGFQPATLRTKGWMLTQCDSCYEKSLAKLKK